MSALSGTTQFLISLMTRMPEDVEALAGILDDDWQRDLPRFRQGYLGKKKPDDPPTLEEFIEQKDPDHMARWTMNVLPELMDHAAIGQSLNAIRWFVLTMAADAPGLLSSDRPPVLVGSDRRRGLLPDPADREGPTVHSYQQRRDGAEIQDAAAEGIDPVDECSTRQTGGEERVRRRQFRIGIRRQIHFDRSAEMLLRKVA